MTSLRVHWNRTAGGITEEQSGCYLAGVRSRHKFSRNCTSFVNLNQHRNLMRRRANRLTIVAKGGNSNRSINQSGNTSLFNHIIDSDSDSHSHRHTSSYIIQINKQIANEEDVSEEIDQWVRDSVAEIVSNLDEAPFLVHVFRDTRTPTPGIKLVREKATTEKWPFIKRRWEGGSPIPNGVILVEELSSQESETRHDKEMSKIVGFNNRSCSSTKIWGLLIQGKGLNCTACYILKTSRVQCVTGFCTHFCLARVNCFIEQAGLQLKKLWLQ